ncbi:MAG: hypothetical protein AB7I08_12250 [Thermoleophilia bacterium]
MSAAVGWVLVGLALGAVASRRHGVAACLVGAQTLLVAAAALIPPDGAGGHRLAALLLAIKGAAVCGIVAFALSRARETRPPDDGPAVAIRLLVATVLALGLVVLLPTSALGDPETGRAAIVLLACGLALTLVRRATVAVVLALLIAENGIALAAVWMPGGLPLVVELGVAFDVIVVVAVAAFFQRRIVEAFGTGDSAALGSLRG